MSNRLVVRLLGPLVVEAPGGHLAPFEANTARALLAYVAAHGYQPQLRTTLATVLWGADAGPTGLTNLRSALRRVRNAVVLADGVTPCLLAERDTVQLHPDVAIEVDIDAFEALLRGVEQHAHPALCDCAACAERQRQAVALYHGDFLADLDIANEQFEQWRSSEQHRFRQQVMRTLANLVEYEMRHGSLEEAERLARHQLALERWNEEAHRQLMRILLAGGRRSAALAQYDMCRQVLDDELGAAPAEETDALYAYILAGEAPPALRPAENPYRSLDAFGPADTAYFFGREEVVKQLLAAVTAQPLVALIGPSGSGKSSVIYAGLGPLLAAGSRLENGGPAAALWRVVSLRPGPQPLHALAEALAALGCVKTATGALLELLTQGRITLPALAAASGAASPACEGSSSPNGTQQTPRCLLVVDQFEEVFTLCHDAVARAAFLHFLLSVMDVPADRSAATVLLAMRADFLGEALQHRELAAALQRHTLLLGPMTRRDVQRAIEEPARLQGVVFEPGLVERLLDDVGSAPGRLPLLQFALAMLWLRQQEGWLTHAIYDTIGGVRGALAEYTEEVFLQLSLAEQLAARSVFLTLVEPGLNAQDVRHLTTRAEIGETNWPLVQRLADARLLVTNTGPDGEETAELAHEALIREWKRLREWLASDRVFRNWQQQMRLAAEHWRRGGQEDDALLQGARLAEAERWLSDRHADVTPLLRRYIEASVLLRERRHIEETARREHELAQAQALAAAEHRRAEFERAARLRLSRLVIGIALATLLAVGAAAMAALAQQDAAHYARVAHSRQITAQAINVMHAQPDLALLLGLEALRLDNSADSKMALYSELDIHPMLLRILHGPPSQIYSIGLRDTREVIASNEQGAIVAWEIAGGQQRALFDADEQVASPATVSPDGLYFVTTAGPRITLWDAEAMTPLATLDGQRSAIAHISFTADSRRLLSADADGRVLLWSVPGGVVEHEWRPAERRPIIGSISTAGDVVLLGDSPLREDVFDLWDIVRDQPVGQPLVGHTDAIHGYAVSPDGSLLATSSFDGSVRLWDTATGEASGAPLLGHDGRVLFAAFSPDGQVLATGGTDTQVILWDVSTHRRLGSPLAGHSNWVRAGRFSADGSLLATADESGSVLLWDLQRLRVLLGHSDRVRSLALSPDGATLVTSGFDKRLIAWDAATLAQRQVIETEHHHSIISVRFSPDGRTFVSVDAGGYILFWDTGSWQPRYPLLRVTDQPLIGLSFSPDGRTLAGGSFDGVVRFWDVASGLLQPVAIPAYTTGWALSVRFDPAGKLLASGGGDGVIKLWDVANGEAIGEPLVGHTSRVTDLLFSPDGKTLTSASADGTIRFWDVASGEEVSEPLVSGRDQVWSIWRADGGAAGSSADNGGAANGGADNGGAQRLLALHQDGSLADWDTAAHTLNLPLAHIYSETEEMQVAAAGDRAYIASTGSMAHVLSLDDEDWAAAACRIANRTLSEDEWRKYMHQLPYDPACR